MWKLILLAVVGLAQAFDWDELTPLDDYVWRELPPEEEYYSYYEIQRTENEDYTHIVLNMTSQRWWDETVSEDSIWWHYVTVVIPTDLRITDAAMLYIGGGNKNADPPSTGSDSRLINWSVRTGAVAGYVRCVPYQPIRFTDDLIGRTEDQIIARTWRYYIEDVHYDPDIILNLAMTKAAKRAVDTVIEVANEENNDINIDKIMPTGFSKRGWTAWLLACTDQRVFALAPVVLDLLNWNPNLHHHNQAYGGWSWAFQPYWAEEVSRYIDHPRSYEVFDEVAIDPLAYDARLASRPKLIASGSGDQFFLPDDANYFWDLLEGDNKFLQIMENTDHGLGGQTDRLWKNFENFFIVSYREEEFPRFRWEIVETEDGAYIDVDCDESRLISIRGWSADTTNVTVEIDDDGNELHRRDFRMRTLLRDNPIVWDQSNVEDIGNGEFRFGPLVARTDGGYTGFFVEASFSGSDEDFDELNFTTQMKIIPDVFPFEKCASEEECRGRLV